MTQPKRVSKSIKNILEHPIMEIILDRSQNIKSVIPAVLSWWDLDMVKRKPGPAYINDKFVGTDLDLSCLLFSLFNRGIEVNLPEYKIIRPRSVKEGQKVTSKFNRNGKIIGLTSNSKTFLFSLRIIDKNVINFNKRGYYRNFAVTNLNGDLYEHCKQIQFAPNESDTDYFNFHQLLSKDNTLDLQYFVHPARWTSIFGSHYLMTKALIKRLQESVIELKKQIKEMRKKGYRYQKKKTGYIPVRFPKAFKEKGKSIKVDSFQVEVDFPQNKTKFQKIRYSNEYLLTATRVRDYFQYILIPKLQFATRCCELAYFKYGQNRIPSWVKGVKWESGFRILPKRTRWDRAVLFQPKPFELGVSVRKRLYQKSETVNKNYEC
jgi:hypothetical protein